MTRPVILVDDTVKTFQTYESVTAAADAIGLHPSTVHRALTGDRGMYMVGSEQLFVLDFIEGDTRELEYTLAD